MSDYSTLYLNRHGDVVGVSEHADQQGAETEAREWTKQAHLEGLPMAPAAFVHGPLARFTLVDGEVVVDVLAVPVAEVEALRARVAELEARMAVPRSHELGGCYKYTCHNLLPDGNTLEKVSYRSQDGADECARHEGSALLVEGHPDHVFAVVSGPLTRYRLGKGVVVVEPIAAPVTEVEGAFQEGS